MFLIAYKKETTTNTTSTNSFSLAVLSFNYYIVIETKPIFSKNKMYPEIIPS